MAILESVTTFVTLSLRVEDGRFVEGHCWVVFIVLGQKTAGMRAVVLTTCFDYVPLGWGEKKLSATLS